MKRDISLEREDLDAMHDVILEALDYKNEYITDDLIKEYWGKLPDHIKGIAIQWGCNDTVFRDEMYVWVIKNKKS
jgi:hypothetical protein